MHIFILFMREYTYKYDPHFLMVMMEMVSKKSEKESAKLQYFFKDHSERTTCKLVRVQQYCVCVRVLYSTSYAYNILGKSTIFTCTV